MIRILVKKLSTLLFENGSEEVSGEKVWKKFVFFDSRKSDYSMEKVKFPENSLLYINQAYLTVKKSHKKFIVIFLFLGSL